MPEPNEGIISKEVFEKVTKEIATYSEDSKKQYEELRKSYEALSTEIKDLSDDGLQKERITKLSEDLLVRQDKLDEILVKANKEVTERIDMIETALNRPGFQGKGESEEAMKEAHDFLVHCKSVQNQGKGVNVSELEALEKQVSLEGYISYQKAFEGWARKWGGNNQIVPNPEHIKSLSVGVDPDGGYTVTPAMSNQIIGILYESDPIRQLAARETITTGALEWLVDWDDVGSGWEGETETGAETTTSQFKKKRIPVYIVYAKPQATQVLLEDSGINIESWLASKIADRFLRREAVAFVEGDGTNKPRGFLTYASGTSFGQIEQVAMGAAATLTYDGFIDVKFSLKEQFLNRGTWLMNRLTVAEVLKLKDGNGRSMWEPGLSERASATILGLPYRMSTTMPQVAANALSVALADWKQAYMIVDRLGITVQRDPYTQKPFVEFYSRKRVGGDVINWDAIKIGKVSA